MAPFALPLIKLSALFLKQVAKPISSRLKVEALKSRRMHNMLCSLGEFSSQAQARVNVYAAGYRFVGMKPLPVEEALTNGITFVSESIVVFLAGSLATYEYTKSVQSGTKKEEKLTDEFKSIRDRLTIVEGRLEKMEESKVKFKAMLLETQRREREKEARERKSSLKYQAWLAYGQLRKYVGEVLK